MAVSKFKNLDTDITLGGNNPQDDIIASQKAVKTALDTKVNISDISEYTASEVQTLWDSI